jgi:hypothetical protein
MQATGKSHTKLRECNICNTGQGKTMNRNYKKLELGGGQAYECSSD